MNLLVLNEFLARPPPPSGVQLCCKTNNNPLLRCDRLTSCSVPVSSDLFGDPCPGTHKYVEIHYTCSPKTDTPDGPCPPGTSSSPPSSHTVRTGRLTPPPPVRLQTRWRTRPAATTRGTPILVATTTNMPKRVPITTPRPTTTSTTSTSSTTKESVTSDVYEQEEEYEEQEEDEVAVFVDESNEVKLDVTEGDSRAEVRSSASPSASPWRSPSRSCGSTAGPPQPGASAGR